MAMSVTYTTFCGIVIHENRGGTERDYMQDPLGSTAALLDNTQTKTDTWEYWPYGEVSARTGTNPTPLTFVGLLGYFKDILDKLFYIRARHLKPDLGRWLTVDPWMMMASYEYVDCDPIAYLDPGGLYKKQSPACKGISGSIMIIPEPGDWTGVSSGIGDTKDRYGVISAKDAIMQSGRSGDCVAVNGGFYWPTLPKKTDKVDTVGGVEDCRGRRAGGGIPATKFNGIPIIPIRTKHGFTHGRPDRASGDSGGLNHRTGACLNKDGSIRFIIVVPTGGITFSQLRSCIESQCKGGVFANMDSGGSSQFIERKHGKFGNLLGGPREVENWIVICD